MSTRYLSAWGCSIDQRSSNSVLLSGYSESYMPVSKIWVTLYLQRWDGSQWVTISGGYNATAYNTVSVTGKHNLTVTPGYYYRNTSATTMAATTPFHRQFRHPVISTCIKPIVILLQKVHLSSLKADI